MHILCLLESGVSDLANVGMAEHVGRGILRFSAVFFGSAGTIPPLFGVGEVEAATGGSVVGPLETISPSTNNFVLNLTYSLLSLFYFSSIFPFIFLFFLLQVPDVYRTIFFHILF